MFHHTMLRTAGMTGMWYPQLCCHIWYTTILYHPGLYLTFLLMAPSSASRPSRRLASWFKAVATFTAFNSWMIGSMDPWSLGNNTAGKWWEMSLTPGKKGLHVKPNAQIVRVWSLRLYETTLIHVRFFTTSAKCIGRAKQPKGSPWLT